MDRILMTGASSGLGREIAITLSKANALILTGRREEALRETKAMCAGEDIEAWPCDLSDLGGIEESFAKWRDGREMPISGLVHSAGVAPMIPCRRATPEQMIRTFSVNTFAAAMLVKMLVSRKVNGLALRSVVFISSNISNRGAAAMSIYGASKSALDGMMRSLAAELAPRVRVNSVLPGGMRTDMTKDMFDDDGIRDSFESHYPLGVGSPDKVAPMVEFLLSDRSSWITGQQFTIDGGRTIDITERRQ